MIFRKCPPFLLAKQNRWLGTGLHTDTMITLAQCSELIQPTGYRIGYTYFGFNNDWKKEGRLENA